MRPFEDFLNTEQVKKTFIDKNLIKSLMEQAQRRLHRTEKEIITEENCDFLLEDYYEAMRTLTDAWLYSNGYKSYSHEATIAYLAKDKEFTPMLLEGFDRLRRLRHGTRYYGKRVTIADSKEAQRLAKILFDKLKPKLIKEDAA